ncbi:MAG: acyltransferase family protein [Panacagrimonas sp.]
MRFKVLDGWRGVCALLVALYHLNAYGHANGWPLVRGAYMFVDFFFVLSGFVMTHAYADDLTQRRGLGQFLIRRLGRLWPLHLATLGVMVALEVLRWSLVASGTHATEMEPFTGKNSLESIPTNFFLLHAFGIHDTGTWNAPSWSIAAEFYTYIVFGLGCWLARSRLNVLAGLLVLGGAAVIVRFSPTYIDTAYDYGFFRCIYGFFCGVLVYRLVSKGKPGALMNSGLATLAEVAGVVVVFVFVSATVDRFGSFAAPLVFALVIYVFAFESGAVSRLLWAQAFQKLGTWSYSLYMVHFVILLLLGIVMKLVERKLGISLHQDAFFGTPAYTIDLGSAYLTDLFAVVYLLIVIGVAALSYRFIEEPGRLWFYRMSAGKGSARRSKK